MIQLLKKQMIWDGAGLTDAASYAGSVSPERTMTYAVLSAHNTSGDMKSLRLRFDAMASHDITYVGIIQSARASGLTEFPLPYVLTNCHNSLCAVGGTINEDDHVFGLSAAKKYGGIYVPANLAVIHSYMREMFAAPGKMLLGSDSHTRYGALGALSVGEGGPELVKQLLRRTYDIAYPRVIAVELRGKVRRGVGPQDVALALIGATFKNGFVKNAVLEFVGEGISALPVEFRNGIDVMTTESACLSSIWMTDDKVRDYLALYGREGEYRRQAPEAGAAYDGAVVIDLDKVEPMIALPFHPSNVYKLADVIARPEEILGEAEREGCRLLGLPEGSFRLTDKIKDGKVIVSQGVIAGCAGGTYDNIAVAANILRGRSCGNGRVQSHRLSRLPARQYRAGEERSGGGSHGERRGAQTLLLRTLLRRGRCALQQRLFRPSHHQELRETRGLQARRRADRVRRAHGRPFHRRDRGERRRADLRARHGLRREDRPLRL